MISKNLNSLNTLEEIRKVKDVDLLKLPEIVLARVLNNFSMFVLKDDEHVGFNLIKHGFWEPLETLWFIKNIDKGDRFLDIGSNYGYFSELAAALVGTHGIVYGFEANRDLCDLSKCSSILNSNNLDRADISYHNLAISDSSKDLILKVNASNPGGSGTSTFVRGESKLDHDKIVKGIRLDSVKQDFDIFKIDIEGGEELAFKGAGNKLISCKLGLIELGSYQNKHFIDYLYEIFTFYWLDDNMQEIPVAPNDVLELDGKNGRPPFKNTILRKR